jgi:DNA modification methylase
MMWPPLFDPYYVDESVVLYHGDCERLMPMLPSDAVVVTDPPYNIGYRYQNHNDRRQEADYSRLLAGALRAPSVVLHYPEQMFSVARAVGQDPTECVAWVYNTNLPKRWRMWAWFGVEPDWSLLPGEFITSASDKRIAALMDAGHKPRHADWWFQAPCKNVSAEKVAHPAQLPESLMDKVLTITPSTLIIDPFCGSGTTLAAAKKRGMRAIGIDLSTEYLDLAVARLRQEVLAL